MEPTKQSLRLGLPMNVINTGPLTDYRQRLRAAFHRFPLVTSHWSIGLPASGLVTTVIE